MDNTKYLVGLPIIGLVLIFGLSMNVSAIPYISIGNTTNSFTVVPGQDADITVPIMVKNASDSPVKGLQFNVTYNCSMIDITNITSVDIVNVPTAQITALYNRLCNNSPITSILQKAFCFYMNTSIQNNRVNASILFAGIRNISNDKCVLRIAFASYKKLNGDVTIGKIKMHVNGMQNYFTTNYTLPMNITVEKMGANVSAQINVSDSIIHSQAKLDGLIKACRGNANKNEGIDPGDKMLIIRATLGTGNPHYYNNLTQIKECVDLNNNGIIDPGDKMLIIRATLSTGNPHYYNLSANINY